MSFYENIEQGDLKVTSVMAMPRTVSSALGKALSLSPSFGHYLFQPYDYSRTATRAFDQHIQPALEEHQEHFDEPLHILVKQMGHWSSDDQFRRMMTHFDNMCLLVRDPQSQALSWFRAEHKMPSGGKITSAERAALKRFRNVDVARDTLVTPWRCMERRLDTMVAFDNQGRSNQEWCIVDGDILRGAPEETLKALCSKFHIAFSHNMIDGWGETDDKTTGLTSYHSRRHWIDRLRRSDGLKAPADMTPCLEDFSKPVREIIKDNLKTYVRFMSEAHMLMPTPEKLRSMMDQKQFHHTCPIAAYTLVSQWKNTHARQMMLHRIRDELPQYMSSFDIIDIACGREPLTAHESRTYGVKTA